MPIGLISIVIAESRLNGTLLAIQGSSDPFGDATGFLAGIARLFVESSGSGVTHFTKLSSF